MSHGTQPLLGPLPLQLQCGPGEEKLLSVFLSFGLFMAEVHYAWSQPGKNIMYVKSLKREQTNACSRAKVLIHEGPHQADL